MAMVWLYAETNDPEKVASFATGILWMILPSFLLFIALPLLLRRGFPFGPSLLFALCLTAGGYAGLAYVLKKFGVDI